jgi:ubiquinone biosynthesis protein
MPGPERSGSEVTEVAAVHPGDAESGRDGVPVLELLHHAGRYREVAEVFARHGLGVLSERLGLAGRLLRPSPGKGAPHAVSEAVHLRLALSELGPVFIKLGQMLSTRPDVVPPEYVAELAKLQSSAPPVSGDVIRAVIEGELHAPTDVLFAEFDPTPLASASIGQAHAATLHDGTRVVVKVQRPDAPARVSEDLEILLDLAMEAQQHSALAADTDVVELTTRFAATLRAELDYLREGRNAERFRADLAADGRITVPRVFWTTTTSRVLTMERVGGVKVDDLEALDRAGIDRSRVIRDAVDAVAQMVFVHGFFHADPHPGNLFVQPSGRIALIDFGMVGEIDDELRDRCTTLFLALAGEDARTIASALLRMAAARGPVDRVRLDRDVAALVGLYAHKRLGDVRTGTVVTALFEIVRHHRLQLPATMVLLLRMILMIDGMGRALDPAFQIGTAVRPYIARLGAERMAPGAWLRRAARARDDLAELTADGPGRLRRLAERIEADGVPITVRAGDLDPLMLRLERIGNRLVGGMIAASLISGIGELTLAGRSPSSAWAKPLLHAGAGGVGVLGAYLIWTARTRGRR